MKLFDLVKINISNDDEKHRHMIHYNGEIGTIIGESSFLNPHIIDYLCYHSEYIIKFRNTTANDGNMACILPEECLELLY